LLGSDEQPRHPRQNSDISDRRVPAQRPLVEESTQVIPAVRANSDSDATATLPRVVEEVPPKQGSPADATAVLPRIVDRASRRQDSAPDATVTLPRATPVTMLTGKASVRTAPDTGWRRIALDK
jgi:hypothetical protein